MRDPVLERKENTPTVKQAYAIWSALILQRSWVGTDADIWVDNGPQETVIHMATNQKSNNWRSIEFLDFSLDRNDEKPFGAWAQENSSTWGDLVDDLLSDGYKLSISPDARNQCTIVTITDKSDKGLNTGKCFSSRAELWVDAMLLALYKHYVIAEGQEWPTDRTRSNWG